MHPKTFLSKLDEEKILAAIAAAEKKTSGEICVYVSSKKREDALEAAQKRFLKLGLTKTRHRNAVLIYFAPLTHKFAVVGDAAIHAKCGEAFWQRITGEMAGFLKREEFTQAIIHAVEKVGAVLVEHFPAGPDDINELPDAIIRD
jgi:uncharacterized membrane protein